MDGGCRSHSAFPMEKGQRVCVCVCVSVCVSVCVERGREIGRHHRVLFTDMALHLKGSGDSSVVRVLDS